MESSDLLQQEPWERQGNEELHKKWKMKTLGSSALNDFKFRKPYFS